MSQITITGNLVKVTIHARRDSKFSRLYAIAVKEFNTWQRTPTARNLRYTSVSSIGRESAEYPSNPQKFFHTEVFRLEGLPAGETPAEDPSALQAPSQPRYWVGVAAGTGNYFEIEDPKDPARGDYPQFCAIIGPFRTRRGTAYMRDYGKGNPHLQTAGDADRLAKAENYSGYAWNPIRKGS